MLTKLEVYNARNALLSLPLSGSGPYVVKDIEGLDPIKAEISMSSFSKLDGEQFQGARGGSRNIVLTLGYAPDYAALQNISALRLALYAHFMPKSPVKLVFTSTHMTPVEITGYVETCVTKIFDQEPAVQVSIRCPKSDFINPQKQIILGSCNGTADVVIDYEGTAEAGFVLKLTPSAAITGWSMRNSAIAVELFTVTSDTFWTGASGSIIDVSTVPGDKYATCSSDVVRKMLTLVRNSAVWLKLYPGSNTFRVNGPAASPWEVSYYERFGGI